MTDQEPGGAAGDRPAPAPDPAVPAGEPAAPTNPTVPTVPAESPEPAAVPAKSSDLSKFADSVSRTWLYVMALIVVGILVAPVAWVHPRIGRGEKLFIIFLGFLNTAAAAVVFVLAFIWFLHYFQRQLAR